MAVQIYRPMVEVYITRESVRVAVDVLGILGRSGVYGPRLYAHGDVVWGCQVVSPIPWRAPLRLR